MKLPTPYRIALTLLLAGLPLAGCAKKAPQPPPAPPVTQKQEPVPTPPPPPAPKEEPAPTPAPVGSGDFQPVFFDFDAYTLREDGRTALDRNAKLLRDNPNIRIQIEGHCDERGTAEYNQALGERRAQAARDYLAAAGIAAARMDVVSYGKERPFAEGHDEASWQQNRRAQFVIRQ
jgi:peptidoglycan-associated lipoprotein